jgi:hypothetical protein
MGHSSYDPVEQGPAWNAGKKLGAKRPLKPKDIWEIRFMLDRERRLRDRALFDLAIDSKLRGCDLVKVRIGDFVSGGRVRNRAMVIQQKTKRPVQFELLDTARSSLLGWSAVAARWRTTPSQARSISSTTSAPVNIQDSLKSQHERCDVRDH